MALAKLAKVQAYLAVGRSVHQTVTATGISESSVKRSTADNWCPKPMARPMPLHDNAQRGEFDHPLKCLAAW